MIKELDVDELQAQLDLANEENYEKALNQLDRWIEVLAINGPDGLVDVYSEMVDFLKIAPKDLAENKENSPSDVLESLDILSAQCGIPRIRTPNKRRIKAFILSAVALGLGSCFHSDCKDICPEDTALHSFPEEGHGPNPFE
jgi:hypothetical protein